MGSITIREEAAADRTAVYELEQRAFGRAAEADLVEQLREHGKVSLSLVALEGDRVVGQVLFSPGHIAGPAGSVPVQGMGPVAVLPERQGQGIGSALVRAGLEQLCRLGHTRVVVEGNPRYYMRFGFQNATPLGILCEFNPPPGCFMVQELQPGALAGVSGICHYAEEFQAVG